MSQKTAVFDLDGAILSTLEDLQTALNVVLAENNMPLRTVEDVRRFIGNGIRKLIERGAVEGTPSEQIDAMHVRFLEFYDVHCTDKTAPYPGVPELVAALRAEGWKTAVVSNKRDKPVNILCERFFPGLFDIVVGEREGVRRKPAPDSVNEVIAKLGVNREDCIYIGDSGVDIETAANAGLPVILVEWGFREKADLIRQGGKYFADSCDTLHELLNELSR